MLLPLGLFYSCLLQPSPDDDATNTEQNRSQLWINEINRRHSFDNKEKKSDQLSTQQENNRVKIRKKKKKKRIAAFLSLDYSMNLSMKYLNNEPTAKVAVTAKVSKPPLCCPSLRRADAELREDSNVLGKDTLMR